MPGLSAILGAIIGPLAKVIVDALQRWTELAWLRGDAARDQRLKDTNASLTAAAEEQAKLAEGQVALTTERAKDPERLSKDWWMKGAGVVVLTLALGGCTTVVKTPLTVTVVVAPTPRPAFPEITKDQQSWLGGLVAAYEANCVSLAIIGGSLPSEAAAKCLIR